MHIYKIIFVSNTILSCKLSNKTIVMEGEYMYQQYRGQLIYAFVKAENEDSARQFAQEIITQAKAQ